MNTSEIITFEPSSQEDWKQKIVSDLKGKSYESLMWKSEVGEIDSVLFDFDESKQIPGEFPFQRGYSKTSNQWKVLVSVSCFNSLKSNELILKSLSQGANALKLINPISSELDIVLKNVMLDIIGIQIVTSLEEIDAVKSAFNSYCLANGYELSNLDVSFCSDTIGDYFKSGKHSDAALSGSFLVDVNAYVQGGARVDRQIALALAHGHEYFVQLVEKGVAPNEAARLIEFNWAVGTTYFLEISKLRAFRALWAFVLSNYGVEKNNCTTKIHAQTSNFYYSNLDVHSNLLRATTSAMAAVIGGCNTLEVKPYDFNLPEDKKSTDAYRLAINIQLILQEEAYLNQVVDAAGGAYFIESITEQLKEKAYQLFQEIEHNGGVVAYFQKGQLSADLNSDLQQRKADFEEGKTVLVGVNKFPNPTEKNVEEKNVSFSHNNTINEVRLAQL